MKPKFTPGDWYRPEFPHDNEIYFCKEDDPRNLVLIAEVGPFYSSPDEQLANAQLFHASKGLYEALCDMVSDKDNLSEATVDFAKRALAKARGEE